MQHLPNFWLGFGSLSDMCSISKVGAHLQVKGYITKPGWRFEFALKKNLESSFYEYLPFNPDDGNSIGRKELQKKAKESRQG